MFKSMTHPPNEYNGKSRRKKNEQEESKSREIQAHRIATKTALTSRRREKKMASGNVATQLVASIGTKNTGQRQYRGSCASVRKYCNLRGKRTHIVFARASERAKEWSITQFELTYLACQLLYVVTAKCGVGCDIYAYMTVA